MKNLRLIFPYLNIKSVRNKFKNMSSLISQYVDILIVFGTKPDSSFPTTQFLIPDFHHIFGLDINKQIGGLLVYVKGLIPARVPTSFSTLADTQIKVFELNLRKDKWLFVGIYKPPSLSSQCFRATLSDLRYVYSNIMITKLDLVTLIQSQLIHL